MDTLIQLYEETFGFSPASTTPLDKAGSNRTYIRMTAPDGTTCIGVIGLSQAENDAFIYLTRHFHALGLNVPELSPYLKRGVATCNPTLARLRFTKHSALGEPREIIMQMSAN